MRILTIITICLLTITLISCSSGRNQVLSPDIPNEVSLSNGELVGYRVNDRNVFGAWKVRIDLDSLESSLVPAVNAKSRDLMAIGDFYDADLSQFLTVSPCADCLQLTNLKIANSLIMQTLRMDFTMQHPFGNLAKRPDLHGFDVRLIFISASLPIGNFGIDVMRPDGSLEQADIAYDFYSMTNADGFTSHFDELAADDRYFVNGNDVSGNLNPFLRYFENWSAPTFDPHAPSGHNVMPVGSSNYTRTAIMSISTSGTRIIEFYAVADVSYGQSAILANRQNPQYYLPAFHRTEPWRVEYWIENNGLDPTNPLSTADVIVQVFDWQQGATVDSNYPDPANLAGIPESSNVKQVELSVPFLQTTPVVKTSPDSGSGTPDDPLQFTLKIKNELGNGEGITMGLLAVRDELYGKAAPSGREPIPVSPSGFPYETLDIRDYSLYQTIWINLPKGFMYSLSGYSGIFENELIIDTGSLFDEDGSGININAAHFMDLGAARFQYRWDYDFDGYTFDVDGGGMPSPTITFAQPGPHDVALRVRTNSKPPREYIYPIPVYSKGKNIDLTLPTTSPYLSTGRSGAHQIARASDRTFIAYTSNELARREIYLTSIMDDGTVKTAKVSEGSTLNWDCYDPSITIKDSVTHKKVYIAYSARNSTGTDTNVYCSVSDFNLSSFDLTNAVANTGAVYEHKPCIIFDGTNLYCYFTTSGFLDNMVYAIKSTDGAQTWTGKIAVSGSTQVQTNPSAVWEGNDRAYLVWEDFRNDATQGSDLYLATSLGNNGLSFPTVENISSIPGDVDETMPCITIAQFNELAIAYLARDGGSTSSTVHLKSINLSDNWQDDYIFFRTALNTHSQPSVSTFFPGHYVLAFGNYNFSSSTEYVDYRYVYRSGMGTFVEQSLFMENVGNVTSAQGDISPGVIVTRYDHSLACRVFGAHKQYKDGIIDDPTPFQMYFGNIDFFDYYFKSEYL